MKILSAKKGDRHADTSELEKECDRRFGLSTLWVDRRRD
jgi:hypothetical protein